MSGIVADDDVVAAVDWGVGIVGSHDGGASWSTLHDEPFGLSEPQLSGGDLFVATLSGNALVSRDHGHNWTTIPLPSQATAVYDYDRWPAGSIAVTDTAGINRGTEDGTGYTRIGVQGQTVYDLAVAGDAILAATELGTYRSPLPVGSPEWGHAEGEGFVGAGTNLVAVSPSDPEVVWRVGKDAFSSFHVDRSTDGGATWQQMATASEVPTSLLVHPADPDRVIVGFAQLNRAGLFATSDGGNTWKYLHHGKDFRAIVGDPDDARRLWLGRPDGLYRSDDGGVTVTKVVGGYVSAIHVDGPRLVIGGDKIRVSTDGGRSFRVSHAGDLSMSVVDFAAVGDTLYAATTEFVADGFDKGGRGVLRSTNGGRSWQNVSSGLENVEVTTLVPAPDGRALYAGTIDGGVQRLSLSRH